MRNRSDIESYRPPRDELPDDLAKSNANARIDSLCGIRFGEKRPEWMKGNRPAKLQKPFRFFTEVYVSETGSKLVQTINLNGKMRPDATEAEQKEEQQAVLAILERRYGFRFPRGADGKIRVHTLYRWTFGHYKIHMSGGDFDGTPMLHLIITDTDVAKAEARKSVLRKTMPKLFSIRNS